MDVDEQTHELILFLNLSLMVDVYGFKKGKIEQCNRMINSTIRMERFDPIKHNNSDWFSSLLVLQE